MGLPPYFMVFDVESVGLHGEGFAFGAIVVDRDGKTVDEIHHDCPCGAAEGDDGGREWVLANVPFLHAGACCISPQEVREAFWGHWLEWEAKGAVLVADCAWPVEARFLAACVDDQPCHRTREGPHPLHELASFRLAAGLDPLGTNERLPDELPAHDPLRDARQSARLLVEALKRLHPAG